MLIHATVTVTGDAAGRRECEASLRRLLSGYYMRGAVTEHHGPDALCYDLKVEGGIPFPVFATASEEFPDLTFRAEWIDVEAGEKGSATLVRGQLAEQSSERVGTRARDAYPVYLEVARDGRLVLALTVLRAGAGEWRGYALTGGRDALFRIVRREGAEPVELYVTEGAGEWSAAWRGPRADGPYTTEKLEPPLEIPAPDYGELEALVRRFVSDWIWFSHERPEDIAVEQQRYERRGLVVSGGNVRYVRLNHMLDEAGEGQPARHDTLAPEERWIRELMLATWARD